MNLLLHVTFQFPLHNTTPNKIINYGLCVFFTVNTDFVWAEKIIFGKYLFYLLARNNDNCNQVISMARVLILVMNTPLHTELQGATV